MTEQTRADLETQREVVRQLMVLESRIARFRRELTKPIDYSHRQNQSDNRLKEELDHVQESCNGALTLASDFIAAARTRTGWAAYSRYKMRQYETNEAVRMADALFDKAQVEYEQATEALVCESPIETANSEPADEPRTDATENKEQA